MKTKILSTNLSRQRETWHFKTNKNEKQRCFTYIYTQFIGEDLTNKEA